MLDVSRENFHDILQIQRDNIQTNNIYGWMILISTPKFARYQTMFCHVIFGHCNAKIFDHKHSNSCAQELSSLCTPILLRLVDPILLLEMFDSQNIMVTC